MREIRQSGLMSGEGKRIALVIPRLSSTLLVKKSSLPTQAGPCDGSLPQPRAIPDKVRDFPPRRHEGHEDASLFPKVKNFYFLVFPL